MKTKMNHPYQVPERFFGDFRKNLESEIEKLQAENRKSIRMHHQRWIRYAAIFLVLVGVGYISFYSIKQSENKMDDSMQLTVEEILPQISDEELTDFVIENITLEKLEHIKFE